MYPTQSESLTYYYAIFFFNFRYITPDKFYIEALSDGKELLVIDRVSQEISLEGMCFLFTSIICKGS
jgi:hypothetical protein